jgi:DNA-binding HxlR family transcriptional regulator
MGKMREPLGDILNCSLPIAQQVMGERWSSMILREGFNGVHHFEEFLSALGIARNILANRLARLVEHGIMKREPLPGDRRKIEYRLTEKGMDLLPAMLTCARGVRNTTPARRPTRSLRRTRRSPNRPDRLPGA